LWGGGGEDLGKDMGGWWRFFWGSGRAETWRVEGGRSPLLISKPAHNWKRAKRISGAAYLTVKVKNKTNCQIRACVRWRQGRPELSVKVW